MIAIDATCLTENRMTGVERYTFELLRHLSTLESELKFSIFLPKLYNKALDKFIGKFSKVFQSPFENRIAKDQIWLAYKLNRKKPKLLHCPAFPPPLLYFGPTLLTIHDATLWRYPNTASSGGRYYYKPLYKKSLMHSKKILTDSKSSKKDLINYLNISPEQISVISIGTSDNFDYPPPEHKTDELNKFSQIIFKEYILTVGTVEPRKNLKTLIKAYQAFNNQCDNDLDLLIVGRKGWGELNIPESLREKIHFLGYVTDKTLKYLYKNSLMFVFPSLYEGFGLPLLEAMKMGTPCIASETSSLPEVGGEACLYADPKDEKDFMEKIKLLYQDNTLRETLIEKGKQRAKKFSWEKSTQQITNLYKNLINVPEA